MKHLVLILFALGILAGCTTQTSTAKDPAEACITLCKASSQDLAAGPCLNNEIVPDWVCDVAHNPRQAVDNEEKNQCPAFRDGRAHHFVEVDETCKLIRKY